MQFGQLTVLDTNLINGRRQALCRCACGTSKWIRIDALKQGQLSCGCIARKLSSDRLRTHGMSSTSSFRAWNAMMNRCYRPAQAHYGRYGGRGIRVCDRWHSFENFIEDMGLTPIGFQLDRINNAGDYEPGNCRWVTPLMNSNNRRDNVRIEYGGTTMTLAEWARVKKLTYHTLFLRLKRGWSIERALTTKMREERAKAKAA